jgi:D-lactate dehydrogenase
MVTVLSTADIVGHLESIFPAERIKSRLVDVVSYAADAGFYHLVPKAVVQPVSIDEVRALFALCRRLNIPLTFRAGGSSLSGQAITDGILADISQHWRKVQPLNEGAAVKVQPGVTGSVVNHMLKSHKVKIGPDPASINTAMMGGILSNNSSGMCCGVKLNSYHTIQSLHFLLPDGQAYNTAVKEDYTRFETESAELANAIARLRQQVLNNTTLYDKIRRKYLTKNTVGYSLNAFVDYTHPLDIFAHLLIGAEGTLGFIAEAVMDTVPDYPAKSTTILFFRDMKAACDAIVPLKTSGAEMIELMDRASLRSVETIKGIPDIIKLLPESAAGLLVEYQDTDEEKLEQKIAAFEQIPLSLLTPAAFTTNVTTRELYWKIRKGMFPSVGAVRAKGTTVILEDIAFPVEQLAAALADLQVLFVKYEYGNAIIFGHAKDGNIHFVVTQSFNTAVEIERYRQFMDEVVALVVDKYDGTLKAEHGTGRNMAPFVEAEWGAEAYQIMQQLKELVDPQQILNPGVIINDDKLAHIKNLKSLPEVEEEVDKCIECGYCEHKCPSRDLTMTPRRRIVVRRALANFKQEGNTVDHKTLLQQYQYDGLDTCAVDGLCATECPVNINTGDLVKRLRKENHSSFANKVATQAAKHFYTVESVVKVLLASGVLVNKVLGKRAMTNITGVFKKIVPAFPLWMAEQTGPVRISKTKIDQPSFIYFATCITRSMGSSLEGKKSVIDSLLTVAQRAGINIQIPVNIHGHCCGQPFSSKGFASAAAYTKNKTIEWLWQETQQGKLPVILDMSSCTYTLLECRPYLNDENKARFDKLLILDTVDFLYDHVVPSLSIKVKKDNVALHPVCSLSKMKNAHKLTNIAKACADNVHVPIYAGCCGMAGDRGFLFPELVKSATSLEAKEVLEQPRQGYYSSSKTCEMALENVTKKNYESIVYLVEECS